MLHLSKLLLFRDFFEKSKNRPVFFDKLNSLKGEHEH